MSPHCFGFMCFRGSPRDQRNGTQGSRWLHLHVADIFGGAGWLTSHAQCSEFYSICGLLSLRDNLTNRIWRLPALWRPWEGRTCWRLYKKRKFRVNVVEWRHARTIPLWKCILKRRVDLLMTMNRVFVCPVTPLSGKSAFEARTTKKATWLHDVDRVGKTNTAEFAKKSFGDWIFEWTGRLGVEIGRARKSCA